jgi:hypothetical protein
VKIVVSEGVREVWLSSEDTGAYGNSYIKIVSNILVIGTRCNCMSILFFLLFRQGSWYKSPKFVKCNCCGASCGQKHYASYWHDKSSFHTRASE